MSYLHLSNRVSFFPDAPVSFVHKRKPDSLCCYKSITEFRYIPFTTKRTRLRKIARLFTQSGLRWIHTHTRTTQIDTIMVGNYTSIDTEFT